MTRVEAKIILDGFKSNPLFNEQHKQALDMAISALSAEPCDDCISRKAVLELATPVDSMYADITVEMISADDVRKLPSVQPVIPNMTITVDDSYMRNVRRDCGLYE